MGMVMFFIEVSRSENFLTCMLSLNWYESPLSSLNYLSTICSIFRRLELQGLSDLSLAASSTFMCMLS